MSLPASSTPIHASPVRPANLYAGTSGWAYPTWKPGFYPAKLPARRFLEHYASCLNAVEVNYTFRALPSPTMLAGWLAATPARFRFSFKAPQRITHFARLVDCASQVTQFLEALRPAQSGARLGPLLFQLPPNFKADVARLRSFLEIPELNGPAAPRLAFEFRHESWFADDTYEALRKHNVALCIAQGDELITPEVQCAQTHACYRLRRSGGYSQEEIVALARPLTALAGSREVYAFFRHEDEPTGALNATAFLAACAAEAARR